MKPLEIAVVFEPRDDATSMVAAILRELEDALQAYLASGRTHVIDLATLPLGPADRAALQQALGAGEIEVRINALGASLLRETGFAGIWWVRHEDVEGKLLCELLEVTDVPEIVRAYRADIEAASARLCGLTALAN
ncbi:hydrogenase expression/formation C-terminal domain-containing protein [Metallibacterium sp.]|uniref:hydrogenase expression/formation C-terminal domain-containing protein n=1 Tax=Metallibacterium sp. TaxID=2940281 RepID=UPI00260492F4|nr:hydrogenase expression/formation C-terminal domain-containing protein [Metallibacterium sp.]